MPKPAKRPLPKQKADEASPYEMKVFKKPVVGEGRKKTKKSVPEPVVSESSGSESDSDAVDSAAGSDSGSDAANNKESSQSNSVSDGSGSDSEDTGSFVSDVDDSDDERPPVAAKKAKPSAPVAAQKPIPTKEQGVKKPAAPSVSAPADASTGPIGVYIEGIPYAATESDLRKHFEACGAITSVRMPRYQDSGRAMGYAHVDFATPSAAEAAVALDGKFMMGRFLNVEFAREKKTQKDVASSIGPRPASCTTLYVRNLPYDTDEEAVSEVFKAFGDVVSVRLSRWGHTQKLKGFGYVQFKKGESAEAAVAAGDIQVGDRNVLLDYDTGAPKAGFKTAQGQSWNKYSKTLEGSAGASRGGRGGSRGRGGFRGGSAHRGRSHHRS